MVERAGDIAIRKAVMKRALVKKSDNIVILKAFTRIFLMEIVDGEKMERVQSRLRVITIQDGIELVIEDEISSRELPTNLTLTSIVMKPSVTKILEKRSVT